MILAILEALFSIHLSPCILSTKSPSSPAGVPESFSKRYPKVNITLLHIVYAVFYIRIACTQPCLCAGADAVQQLWCILPLSSWQILAVCPFQKFQLTH